MSGDGVTEEWRSHQRDCQCKETVLSVGYLLQQQQRKVLVFCFLHSKPCIQIVRQNFAEPLLPLNKLAKLILAFSYLCKKPFSYFLDKLETIILKKSSLAYIQ